MKHGKPIVRYVLPFLDYCEVEKGLSSSTQRNYRQYLQLFTDWLIKTGNRDLSPTELTTTHVWNYRLYLARQYKTPHGGYLKKKSQNFYLIALRALLNYFADRDIPALTSAKIKLTKHTSDQTVAFLNIREVEKMIQVPDSTKVSGLRDRAIMELLFSTGMRIAELASLNTNQLSFLSDKNPQQTFELSILGKGSRIRAVFVSPRAAEWLRKYLETRRDVHDPLFVNYRSQGSDNTRLSTRSIQRMVSRYAMLAGLSKRVTPHTLRHSFATDLLAKGADMRSVQELLGHKNIATTQIYTHVTNKQLRDVHEKFHGGNASH